MKLQVLFAFGLLTFLNSHAMPPMYRRAERILVEGKPVRLVQAPYGGSFYARGGENHNFNDFVVTKDGVTNISKLFPQYNQIRIMSMSSPYMAAYWQTPVKGWSGYYKDGKLTEVAPWAWNGFQGYLEMTGGGGDWIGGYSTAAGPENPYRTVGLAYNPKTGERIDITDAPYNQFVGATNEHGIIYMSDSSDISDTWSVPAVMRLKDGKRQFLGYGKATRPNRAGVVPISLGPQIVGLVFPDLTTRLIGTKNFNFSNLGSGVDDFGNVFAVSVEGNYFVATGDTWYSLESRIEGGYSLDNIVLDPVTGSLYSGIKGRESEGIYRFDPVPEPGTLAALGLGLAALMRKRKRGE